MRKPDENLWIVFAEMVAIGIWTFQVKLRALLPVLGPDWNAGYFVWLVAVFGWSVWYRRAKELESVVQDPKVQEFLHRELKASFDRLSNSTRMLEQLARRPSSGDD